MSTRTGDAAVDVRALSGIGPMGALGPFGPLGHFGAWATMDRREWKRLHREWRNQWRDEWRQQHRERWEHRGHRHHHWRHGVPLPLLVFFGIFLVANLGMIVGAILLASLTMALFIAGVALAVRSFAPAFRSLGARPRAERRTVSSHGVSLPFERTAAPVRYVGPHAYRQQLLDVLKERYVRGEILLTEYEQRVAQVVRDPSVKHLG